MSDAERLRKRKRKELMREGTYVTKTRENYIRPNF